MCFTWPSVARNFLHRQNDKQNDTDPDDHQAVEEGDTSSVE
jgi:hypothetical protein